MKGNLTVIIPWREVFPTLPEEVEKNRYRKNTLNWVKRRYEMLFPDSPFKLSGNPGVDFNRSMSINLGVESTTTEYVLIGDADTIPHPEAIHEGLRLLELGAPWLLPYGDADYYNADRASSEWILSLPPHFPINPNNISYEHKIKAWSGQVLLRAKDFLDIGGFDERFEGWGYEDNAFTVQADTLLGDHQRVQDGFAIHIWHPVTDRTTWGQPHIDRNRAMYREYEQSAGNPEIMRRLVESRRRA